MGSLMSKAGENISCIDGTCTRMAIFILACRASEKFIAWITKIKPTLRANAHKCWPELINACETQMFPEIQNATNG